MANRNRWDDATLIDNVKIKVDQNILKLFDTRKNHSHLTWRQWKTQLMNNWRFASNGYTIDKMRDFYSSSKEPMETALAFYDKKIELARLCKISDDNIICNVIIHRFGEPFLKNCVRFDGCQTLNSLYKCLSRLDHVCCNCGRRGHWSSRCYIKVAKERLHTFSLIRGLHSNILAVHHHLETESPALLFLTDTQIACPLDTEYLSYPGFSLEHQFRLRVGVCLYTRDDIYCRRLRSLEEPNFSVLWLLVDISLEKILYACVYRPHNGD